MYAYSEDNDAAKSYQRQVRGKTKFLSVFGIGLTSLGLLFHLEFKLDMQCLVTVYPTHPHIFFFLPKNKIDIFFDIKSSLGKIHERKNKIDMHWVPGHKEIKGNELADEQAKEAASEMSKPDVTVEPIFDKKEAVTEIKKQMITKWNLKFSCLETASSIQDVFTEVGKRSCYGEWDRPTFSALNQLLSGHSILNSHRAKIDKNVSSLCETCQEVEDVEHFLFQCAKYSKERDHWNGQWKTFCLGKDAMISHV